MSFDFFSTWHLIRFSGFLALFLMTFSISAGLLSRMGLCQRKKPFMIELHQTSGWVGFLVILFHMILLSKDEYISYQVSEILVPFTADYAPFSSALGTLSFFLFFVVMITSDFFMKKLGRNLWKKVHLFVLPAWILMVLHGILIGTDTEQTGIISVYAGSISLVLLLFVLRYVEGLLQPIKKPN
ncbi:iron reductase [Bacillus sp. FJAT-27231]|uniref:ferric reductase-like transmembrane domain-containing protein n=1 Tax=Bacillus sp. FJAT-27231 TaxID=1679168 RepID=UPI00067148D8|nr:ferric reductase-like transmembrane domain-containing protein [Bacillus sp. FJAT-27231]KMY55293.1 iron reductase [Bacillus sp. FJAT-27231]